MNKAKTKTILILGATHLGRDPRVRRQIAALDGYRLIATTEDSAQIEGVQVIHYQTNKQNKVMLAFRGICYLVGAYESAFWSLYRSLYQQLAELEFDLIIMNDVKQLPLAVRLKREKQVPIYLDLHEYAPGQTFGMHRLLRGYFNYLCRAGLPHADKCTTVNESFVRLYRENFAIECDVVVNAPRSEGLSPTASLGQDIKLVHHGLALPSRKIELVCDLMRFLDERYSLHFYMVAREESYLDSLKEYAHLISDRIYFHQPVAYDEITRTLNQYDVGVYLIPPTNINNQYCLPNKFFEFAHARLAIATGPTPDMKLLIDRFQVGACSQEFDAEDLAGIIKGWTLEDISRFKENTANLILSYNAEATASKIREDVGTLLAEKLQSE